MDKKRDAAQDAALKKFDDDLFSECNDLKSGWPSDSTSYPAIVRIVSEDEGKAMGDENLFSKVKGYSERSDKQWETEDPDTVIPDLLKFWRRTNKSLTCNSALHTRDMILLGGVMSRLKAIVKKREKGKPKEEKKGWMGWTRQYMVDSALRTIEEYMRLSRIKKVEDYVQFGKARLIKISTATGEAIKKDDPNPIGDFLEKNGIKFDPEEDSETSLARMEIDVDTALAMRRLKNVEGIDKAKVRILVKSKISLNKDHVDALKNVQAANGDVNELLDKIYSNQGKLPSDKEKMLAPGHFNDRGQKLVEVIKMFKQDESLLPMVERKIVEELQKLLTELMAKLDQSDLSQ